MSKFSEILVSIMLPAIKEVGKAQIEESLGKIKEHNKPEVFENALKAGNSFFLLLSELTTKTKTKIDDTIVAVFAEAILEAAADSGIEL